MIIILYKDVMLWFQLLNKRDQTTNEAIVSDMFVAQAESDWWMK